MNKPKKGISKSEIIHFLMRVYCYLPVDSEMRYEIKRFVAKLQEVDY